MAPRYSSPVPRFIESPDRPRTFVNPILGGAAIALWRRRARREPSRRHSGSGPSAVPECQDHARPDFRRCVRSSRGRGVHPFGVWPVDRRHEGIDITGGSGPIIDMIGMLIHIERENWLPAGEGRAVVHRPLIDELAV